MATQKSDKCPYESRFGGGFLSGYQYLAENMCARQAKSEKTELPNKFWNDPYWLKKYKLQLKHAHDLLKDFTVAEIIKGLKHPDAKRVYSLGFKSVLVPLIERERKLTKIKIDNQKQVPSNNHDYISPAYNPIRVDEVIQPRKPFSMKKNKLQKLKELDNG